MEVETRKPVLNYVPVTMKPRHVDSKLQHDTIKIQPDIKEAPPPNNFEVRSPKCRKKKSTVWEHFTLETVRDGGRRACCKICKQSFIYSTGSKVAGTSHLKRHLKRHIAKGTCSIPLFKQEKSQATPGPALSKIGSYSATPKQSFQTASVPDIAINSDHFRRELASMIIKHEYPINMVEHSGFLAFTQNIQPRYDPVSFNTVQGDCMAIYLREKQNIQKLIDRMSGRVCLMLDLWSSCRNIGFMFVTGQFIDGDWKVQRKLLNVIMQPYPDSDMAFSHSVAACLSDWNMDGKLFSVTINQQLSNFAFDKLRTMLCVRNPLLLHGQLSQNCLARLLSSMVQDALTSLQGTVMKIRDTVKYVKNSELQGDKFLDLKRQLQVPSAKSLAVDDQTKWNTTYAMLSSALELREILSCLDTLDPDFKNPPSVEDWKHIETLCTCMKPLFETADLLATGGSLTTNLFFHEVWKIQLELARLATIEDPLTTSLTKSMQEKFENYWKSSWIVLAIAVVMDPRFKMNLVECNFSKNYGEEAAEYIQTIKDGIHELFLEYISLPLPLTPAYVEEANGVTVKLEDPDYGIGISSDGLTLTEFDIYIMETTRQQSTSELDQYLQECVLPLTDEFDVLGWWKVNCMKYPTLSKMACDILSISLCTVPASAVFDTKNKEMDSYRSSLRPAMVEALICTKNWLESQQKAETPAPPIKMEVPT